MKTPKKTKRDIGAEILEGIEAMKLHREGKLTLRTHKVEVRNRPMKQDADFFVAAREKFNVSRAVWANMLRVSPRTVEKWEQGGQASPLAATFVELVQRYPDMIERLQSLPQRTLRTTKETSTSP